MLAWVDIETTGLNPVEGSILEVAVMITTDVLEVVGWKSTLVRPASGDLERMVPFVRDMHSKSGLLIEIDRQLNMLPGPTQAADELIHYIHTLSAPGTPWNKVPLAGSSVHFDRAWLNVHMPQLTDMFSYRNVDVSTVKELAQRWAPLLVEKRPRSEVAHRALPDIEASIAELKYYRGPFVTPETPIGQLMANHVSAR